MFKNKYALVYWLPTKKGEPGASDVISLRCITNAKDKKENAVVKLDWVRKTTDPVTGKVKKRTEKLPAKVLLIHKSQKYLQAINVDPMTGKMSSQSKKIFSSEIRAQRDELVSASKESESKAKAQKRSSDGAMAASPDIFDTSSSDTSQHSTEKEDTPKSACEDKGSGVSGGSAAASQIAGRLESGTAEVIPPTSTSISQDDELTSHMSAEKLEVTPGNIRFLESILNIMKRIHFKKRAGSSDSGTTFKIPESFTTPGTNKVEIGQGSGFYLPLVMHDFLEKKSRKVDKKSLQVKKDWKTLTRLVLTEIYGDELGKFCAKGSRSQTQGIDSNLYVGLFNWASEFSGQAIDTAEFLKHVNDCARNRKRAWISEVTPRPKKRKGNSDDASESEVTSRPKKKMMKGNADEPSVNKPTFSEQTNCNIHQTGQHYQESHQNYPSFTSPAQNSLDMEGDLITTSSRICAAIGYDSRTHSVLADQKHQQVCAKPGQNDSDNTYFNLNSPSRPVNGLSFDSTPLSRFALPFSSLMPPPDLYA